MLPLELCACYASDEQTVRWHADEYVFAAEYKPANHQNTDETRLNQVLAVHILSSEGGVVTLHGSTSSELEPGVVDVLGIVATSTSFEVVRARFGAITVPGDCGDLSRQLFEVRIDKETQARPCFDYPALSFYRDTYCHMLPDRTYRGFAAEVSLAARSAFWQNTKVKLAGCLD